MEIAPKSMRAWFALVSAIIWIGIYLTGFSTVHWFAYVPAISFLFSALTGLCLPLSAVLKLFGVKLKITPIGSSN
ncbi:hypothetical protein [Larkinella rosea]|uniref:DUF2892 domain-containing protein n=1 Tax=Larkinella rosea TaxID=2025312 RepID=A0A3P1BDB4_9BACT|nr:hypothetical protein [Larkinella rosea]RRA98772.1 hypothetical protein EHT25_27660 [Larkinella rosea]